MALLDSLIRDIGVPTPVTSTDRAFLLRKLAAIMAGAKRIAGRDFEPKRWTEVHLPVCGVIWLANPPVRLLITPGYYASRDTGRVEVSRDSEVTIEYNGGFDPLPADVYDAVLLLMSQAWDARAGGGGVSSVPAGVQKMQLYDVGSIEMFDSMSGGDPSTGAYTDVFRAYQLAQSFVGTSTLRRSL